MADYTNINKYTNDKIDGLHKAKEAIEKQLVNSTASAISKATENDEEVTVTKKGKSVNVDVEEDNPNDTVDLKEFYKQSPSRKTPKEGGGWYVVVPIRRYTSAKRKTAGMSSGMYKDLLNARPDKGFAEMTSDFLYDARGPGSSIKELNYKPKSKNITRFPRKGGGHTYVSFRTVSNKSHPASWILNRSKADEGNKTTEVRRVIREVIKYNTKN